ncbi:MAG: malto-oligosyltrehalose synthase, partial [Sporichthyaceae bacterium]|nr:malto-oligosyltrehalose synthase [Sporichthyaceae bacterium]
KGVEDTAFYRYLRFTALNEVGGDPGHFGVDPDELHRWCIRQQANWPDAMTTLSTHDTKRSEDVRARLAVLSEVPAEWSAQVTSWRAASATYRSPLLDANTEYLLWQTLVGAWPIDAGRLTAYLEKATREAKRRTTWTEPDEAYDEAVRTFAEAVLADAEITASVSAFVERLAPAFRANVLSQKLLGLTVPGVPDVYQGCDLVDLSLVDPDNRRPVDYRARVERLAALDDGEAPRDLDDEKLLVVSRTLRLRSEQPRWFGSSSTYQRIDTTTSHAFALGRSDRAVTVVSRLTTGLRDGFSDETVSLPGGTWNDLFTGEAYADDTPLARLLDRLPVALLVRAE